MIEPTEGTVVARIANSRGEPIILCLEPWGEIYGLAKESSVEIIDEQRSGDSIEVEDTADGVTVYGGVSSALRIGEVTGKLVPLANDQEMANFLSGARRRSERSNVSPRDDLQVRSSQERDELIVQLRLKGLTVDELAKRFGVSQRTVSRAIGSTRLPTRKSQGIAGSPPNRARTERRPPKADRVA